jgi:hypothetical protein
MSAKRRNQPENRGLADTSTADTTNGYMLGGLLIGVALLIPWYFEIPLIYDVTSPDFNPLVVLPAVLIFIGVVVLARAFRATARKKKFGDSTLSPTSARVGGVYRGTVTATRELSLTGDYHVTLKCIRRTQNTDMHSDSKTADRTIYKDSKTIPAATALSQSLSFDFVIPTGLPGTGTSKKDPNGRVRWVLEVSAPTSGVNYFASFPIRVS